MKKAIIFLVIVAMGMVTTSCDNAIQSLTCSGCDASAPYSNSAASTCYASKSACEAAEGSACVNCT